MTLNRLVRPTVGLMPTIPVAVAGQTIEPSVSVPSDAAHRFAEVGIPELDPQGFLSSA